jgi:MFS family permease
MCGSFGWSFFVSWMPLYMSKVRHPDPGLAKWLNTLPLLVGGATCVIGGLLSDGMLKRTGRTRLSRALFPVCGFAIAAVAMASIPFAPSAGAAVALMCLGSFGNDIGQAGEWASVISIGGRFAGTAFGFVNMVANIGGNTLQPIIGQSVFHNFGWTPLFLVYGSVYLTASILWLFINPSRRFYDSIAEPRGFQVLPTSERN